jgi:AraC-like DNA-binding protein
VRRAAGGWDVQLYILRGAPCRLLSGRHESIALRKLSICLISDRREHAFQDHLCSPIDHIAMPIPENETPQFRVRRYGGASGPMTSSFYIGASLERFNAHATFEPQPLIVLEYDEPPHWLFSGVSLIREEMNRRNVDTGAAGRLCEYLLSKILCAHHEQRCGISERSSVHANDTRLRRVLRLIESDIAAPWTLSGLASAGAMSRSRLTAHWQAQMGISIFDYIAQRRMERAAALLSHDDLDIAAIARKVGYRSHAAFSTAFKRIFDQSPARYRQVARNVQRTQGHGGASMKACAAAVSA